VNSDVASFHFADIRAGHRVAGHPTRRITVIRIADIKEKPMRHHLSPPWATRARLITAGAVIVTSCLAATASAAPPSGTGHRAAFEIDILSSRADYVSGGDARVSITVPRTVPLHQVTVIAGGADVTASFTADASNRMLEGVVGGLPLGASTIDVKANGRGTSRPSGSIAVTNYPEQGPMFSGPHQVPFICETEANGLGAPTDPTLCTADTKVEFLYGSTGGGLLPLPAGERPDDLATTTTSTGVEVDFIVRRETGVINRAVYQTAVLYNPDIDDTDSPEATPGWNGRLVYSYGGGCNAGYHQGIGNGGLDISQISLGYATASSSLNILDNNCNDVLSAETTSMVKEHFIETYGADEHTIGWGGSGGAISQHLIGQNYPGLLDGIVPTLSYPDASTIFGGIGDCRLLNHRAAAGAFPSSDFGTLSNVGGYQSFGNCAAWSAFFSNRLVADEGCPGALPVELRWDAVTNPDGARCTVTDHLVNVLGVNPDTGVAYTLFDNTGVQYGLDAVNNGDITVDQFLEINENIGGLDPDGHLSPDRSDIAVAGIETAYATGRATSGGGGLATMPIIDLRPYLDPFSDIHTRFHSFSMRDRLTRTNGHADNQVIQITGDFGAWLAAIPVALAQMDEWLTSIDADWDERTSADVIAAKPASLVDGCWDADFTFIAETATYNGAGTCNTLYPSYGEPRLVAGSPVLDDVFKCQLAPASYAVDFTDAQMDRLDALFADGVCDFDAPGLGQVPLSGTWLSFGN
jgi:hypothetical protein